MADSLRGDPTRAWIKTGYKILRALSLLYAILLEHLLSLGLLHPGQAQKHLIWVLLLLLSCSLVLLSVLLLRHWLCRSLCGSGGGGSSCSSSLFLGLLLLLVCLLLFGLLV